MGEWQKGSMRERVAALSPPLRGGDRWQTAGSERGPSVHCPCLKRESLVGMNVSWAGQLGSPTASADAGSSPLQPTQPSSGKEGEGGQWGGTGKGHATLSLCRSHSCSYRSLGGKLWEWRKLMESWEEDLNPNQPILPHEG